MRRTVTPTRLLVLVATLLFVPLSLRVSGPAGAPPARADASSRPGASLDAAHSVDHHAPASPGAALSQSDLIARAQAISAQTFLQAAPSVVSAVATTVASLPDTQRAIVTGYGQGTVPTQPIEVVRLAGRFLIPMLAGLARPVAGSIMLILDATTGAEMYVRTGAVTAAEPQTKATAVRSTTGAAKAGRRAYNGSSERPFTQGPLNPHAYSIGVLYGLSLGMGGETTVVDMGFSISQPSPSQYDLLTEEMWVGTNNTSAGAYEQWGETGLIYACCNSFAGQQGNWGLYFFWGSEGNDCQDYPGGPVYVCFQGYFFLDGPYPTYGTHYTLRVWYSSYYGGYVYQINNWTEYIDSQKPGTDWMYAGLESTEDTGVTVPRSYFNPLYWQNVNNGGFYDWPAGLSYPDRTDTAFCGLFDTDPSGTYRISWDVGLGTNC